MQAQRCIMSTTQQPGILDRSRRRRSTNTTRTIRRRATQPWALGLLRVVLMAGPAASQGQADSLHEQIDRLIDTSLSRELPGQAPAAPATDGQFLRRASLDLAGMIPSAAEARDFLDDPSPYKRQALIDRLLDKP